MAINTSSPSSNAQLNGILASVPTLSNTPRPTTSQVVGGVDPMTGRQFTIPTSTSAATPPPAGTSGTGALVVGGGTSPAPGAQPAAPTAASAVSGTAAPSPTPVATTIVPVTTAPITTTTSTPAATNTIVPGGTAFETSGFGKAERNQPITVSADGAKFGFPSFNASARSNTAPGITWGPGWNKVEKDGMWYMEHSNGMKAIPAVEYRITPRPADKVSTVKVVNGWGKKFPDGTIVVFDRKEGPYRLDPQGNKHKVGLGTHTFGGVKLRVFEASVVRTLDKAGLVNVFDSRGNQSGGSQRNKISEALGSANAGATISGGGATTSSPVTASGPGGKDAVTASGPGGKESVAGGGAPGKDGTLVSGGGAVTTAQMTQDVQRLTELARGLVSEIQSGNVDSAKLASLQAQLSALPSGILQAAGAAGTITSDGRTLRHAGEVHATSPVTGGSTPPLPATSPAAAGSPSTGGGPAPVAAPSAVAATVAYPSPAAPGATGGGAAAVVAPVAGVDANATTKSLAAGSKAKLDVAVPAALQGKQARFAQLPESVQAAVAKAFGSDQGAAAFKADQLVAFSANGEVNLVEAGTVYVKHQAQVRGAGPGEEIALTVRPGRQPGGVGATGSNLTTRPKVQGGGGAAPAASANASANATAHAHTAKVTPSVPTVANATVGGGATNSNRIKLFANGAELRNTAFGGLNGSYTWATLPATAKQAILAILNNPATEPGKAFASRTGSGWSVDPTAIIVLDAGYASFMNGLALQRAETSATPTMPPIAGGGPSMSGLGHDASRPPVSGGGGTGVVSPGTPPPVPATGAASGHVGH